MIYTYTAVFTPAENSDKFYVRVPDVPGRVTSGQNLEDAIEQITDALAGCLVVCEDEALPINQPTVQAALPHADNDILSLITVDTIAYRAKTDNRSVRKNVSLPAWLAALADKNGVNCSKVLQEALLQRFS